MIPSAFNREEMLKNMKEMAGIEHINSAQIVFIKADIEEGEEFTISALFEIIEEEFEDVPLDQINIGTFNIIDSESGEEKPTLCLFNIDEDKDFAASYWDYNPPSMN